ncbi:glyoxalase/bleomycin resistance protein/dioxygenase [Stachybotrys elegans]|uniref:Bleomycin resistance protein n=1 Tax=Stachybotrys elegans TaxID=80388 RepID=A0A8K0SEA4_9HYPO|nr:glyoxalase/bleomycin resistance protein/dioxygenase [Stachybotrys elegans]
MSVTFHSVVPVLRIFDVAKADEFYVGFLGFDIDWDHRFDETLPLYRQISKEGLILHLSEHHGDGSPGSHVRVLARNLQSYQAALVAKTYRYLRPGLEEVDGRMEMCIIDPFGNRITFYEPKVEEKD